MATLVIDCEAFMGFPDTFGQRGNFQFVRREGEFDVVALVCREQGDTADGFQEFGTGQFDAFFVVGRNDLAEVRIVAVDEFADQQSVINLEGCLVMRETDFDFADIVEQAAEFADGLGGQDGFRLLGFREVQFIFHHGEAAAIRGDKSHLTVLEGHGDAVEYITCGVGGDGVFRAADTFAQDVLFHGEFHRVFKGGEVWELVGGKAVEFELGAAAFHGGLVLRVDIYLDFRGGKFADNAQELFGRQGDGAFAQDIGWNDTRDADVQVGGGKAHLAVFRLHQDVGQDGKSGPGGNHAYDLVESVKEDVFGYAEFHGASLSFFRIRILPWPTRFIKEKTPWNRTFCTIFKKSYNILYSRVFLSIF